MTEPDIRPVQALKDTMLSTAIDSLEDIAEIGLDMLLQDGPIKELPIIGFLSRIGKGASSVRDAITAKKILVFVQQVRENSITDDALQQHIEELNGNPKKQGKELETILDYIDKQTGYIKSKILGNFYYSFLNKDISWDDLIILADVTDDISIPDIETLKDLYEKREYLQEDCFDINCAKRLDRCSLIDFFNGMAMGSPNNPNIGIMARINNLGDVFVEVGLKNIEIDSIIEVNTSEENSNE